MAFMYVSEYRIVSAIGPSGSPIGQEPSIDQAPVAIGGVSEETAAFQSSTLFVRIDVDTACSIVFINPGDNTTVATTSNKRMPANATEYFGVRPGMKVAVIANS